MKYFEGKRNLVKAPQVVELDLFALQADGEDEALGIKGDDRPTRTLHQTHTVRRSEVPHPYLR